MPPALYKYIVSKRQNEKKVLGTFEKYLTLWVIICIIVGIISGRISKDAQRRDIKNDRR